MKLAFNAGKVTGDYIYYSDNFCNGLFKYSLLDDYCIYLGEFPNEPSHQSFLHRNCFTWNGKQIFTPNMASTLTIYSPKTNEFESVVLNRLDDSRFCFSGSYLNQDTLYIIPGNTKQGLICVNLKSMKMEEYDPFYAILKESGSKNQSFWKSCINSNSVLILPKLNTNKIVLLNLITHETELREIGIDKLSAAFCYDDDVWLCTTDGRVFLWNMKKDVFLEYIVKTEKKTNCSYIVIKNNSQIYLIPEYGKNWMKLNPQNEFKPLQRVKIDNLQIEMRAVHFEEFDIWKNKIFVFPNVGGNIVVINDNDAYEKNANIYENKEYRTKYLAGLNGKTVINEGIPYSLSDFVNYVCES